MIIVFSTVFSPGLCVDIRVSVLLDSLRCPLPGGHLRQLRLHPPQLHRAPTPARQERGPLEPSHLHCHESNGRNQQIECIMY